MSDLEFFYMVMAAFYLWECTHWLRNVTVPFVSWIGPMMRPSRIETLDPLVRNRPSSSSSKTTGRIEEEDEDEAEEEDGAGSWLGQSFNLSQPFFVANSHEGGLHFASPLPVAGSFIVGTNWPFAFSPLGIATHGGAVARFVDQPRFTARRHRLQVNGQHFSRMASASHARWFADHLNQLVAVPEAERATQVSKWVKESLNSSAVVARLVEFSKAALAPSITAAVLMLLVFLAAPLVIWRWGLATAWPWLLGALVISCVVNSIAFFRAHKRLYPELDDERFTHFLMVLLFPPAGMRGRDALSRPLLEQFHPLTVARELCRPARFEEFASRAVRQSRHPRPRSSSREGDVDTVWAWFDRAMLDQVETFVSEAGLDADNLDVAPAKGDAQSKAYCPRCHAQFIRTDGACSDCGVALVRFSPLDA